MCLHQLENHEPVEFGELGIDPVERDQVTYFMTVHLIPKIFQALRFGIVLTLKSKDRESTGIFPS